MSISDEQLEEAEDAPINPNYKQINILDLKNIKEYYGINQNNLDYATELGLLIERVNTATLVTHFQIWAGLAKDFAPFDGPMNVTPHKTSIKDNAYYADREVGITCDKDGEQVFIIEFQYRTLPPTVRVKYFTISYRVHGTKTYIVPRGHYYIALKRDNQPTIDDNYTSATHVRFFDNNDEDIALMYDGALFTMNSLSIFTSIWESSEYAETIDFFEEFIKFDIDKE